MGLCVSCCDCCPEYCVCCDRYCGFPLCCIKRPLRKGRPYFSSEGALLVPDVCVMVDDNINAIGWKQRTKPNIDVPSFDEVLERIQIDIEQDKREASEWIKTAQLEHASIGSFALFAQRLLALGAPCEIIKEAFLCAEEEMEHAELAAMVAGRYGGEKIQLNKYQQHSTIITQSLEELVMSTYEEGCLEETLSALDALKKVENTDNAALKGVWSRIAVDEAHHANYAWRVVRYYLSRMENQNERKQEMVKMAKRMGQDMERLAKHMLLDEHWSITDEGTFAANVLQIYLNK